MPILGLPKVDQSFRPSGRPAMPILGLPKVDHLREGRLRRVQPTCFATGSCRNYVLVVKQPARLRRGKV
jgi:hypothetical protein